MEAMKRIRVLGFGAALLVLLVMPVPAHASHTPIENLPLGAVEVEQFQVTPQANAITPDPLQAGAHPNMRIYARFCDPKTDVDTPEEGCVAGRQGPGGLGVCPPGCYSGAHVKDFKVKLPPGLLGNPTAVIPCPTALYLAASCPTSSIVGWSLTNATHGSLQQLPTPLYSVEPTGLEPARLGTGTVLATPPGPFTVIINVRTDGDFGIDSTVNDIAIVAGGFVATVVDIEAVLCGQAPCLPTNALFPSTVRPIDPATAKPFFVNPTSCKPAITTVEVNSWAHPDIRMSAQSDTVDDPNTPQYDPTFFPSFTPTGCDAVPFTPQVTMTPDSTEPGKPSGMGVTIQYPDYENDNLWQAALKDADVTLPDGVTLAPGGGIGLEECTADQFGLLGENPTRVNNDPVRCPAGSIVGDVTVETPVVDTPLQGKAFFGPSSGAGRPTPDRPWRLFIVIEGAGLRIKLVGHLSVSESGRVRTTFVDQPEVPFTRFSLHTRGGDNAVLANPTDCNPHAGQVTLNGYNGASETLSPPYDITGCSSNNPADMPFAPKLEEASAEPSQAGAFSRSRLVFSRPDGQQQLRGLKLSLPPGAVGSLTATPLCPAAQAIAGTCPEETKVGNIRTTVGWGNGLLTVPGSVYIGEPIAKGDVASFVIVDPAQVGPIDLGRVVVVNRVQLRPSDTGVDVTSGNIPTILEGVPLPLRRIEINVTREKFFINPSGCDPRTFVASFRSDLGKSSASSASLAATGCNKVPFSPKLRMIAGGKGLTATGKHPGLKAVVTQNDGEAAIAKARVVVPNALRPNVPQFQKPGALCSDVQLATRSCPPQSQVGSANVITPLLPFTLNGPVYIVQEAANPLPKLAVLLRGHGLEVVLNARNGFQGIKILNTFDTLPDVPQSRFELKINGGSSGILNAFSNLCKNGAPKATPSALSAKKKKSKKKRARKRGPQVEALFTGQNAKSYTTKPRLEVTGCATKAAKKKSKKRSRR
jgi:hypothetical protein